MRIIPHFKFKVASSSFSASLQNCTHFTCTQNSLNRLILSDLICFRIRKGEIKSITITKCRHKIRTKCVENIRSEKKEQNFEEKSKDKIQSVRRVSSNPWCQAAITSCELHLIKMYSLKNTTFEKNTNYKKNTAV